MTPRRILVTGASGFVGGHLVPRLAAEFPEAELILPDMDALDMAEEQSVLACVRAARPNAVIHLAAISVLAAARQAPERAWTVNLHGALALAGAILREAPECVLLHVSTADAYGSSFASGAAIDETAPLAPMNLYAATKAAADLALGALTGDGLRCIRLRPFNHTGSGQSPELVVAAFARRIARMEAGLQPPSLHVGALDPMRDFLDVRDVCAAYAACLRRAETLPRGAILNIASGVPRRIGDVLTDMLAIAGVTAEVETGTTLLRPSDIPLAHGNAAAARAALDWAPMVAWERTLRDVIDDWRERVRQGE